jgi:crotonobetainyl-CoA:carnitine CoA-transferase CaiB-like acyl-CoA transferase
MLLGDMGADVVKVESPTGDPTRTTPPYYCDGTSVYFLSINRNKRSVVIDLKNPNGLSVFYDLVKVSDIVAYNFRPGVAERLRIDHATLLTVSPRIITCNVTGFGVKGPESGRRAVDVVVQAMGGGMSITGEEGGLPTRAGIPTADLGAGLFSAIGILAALHRRDRTNCGVEVETSLFHSQLALLSYVASYYLYSKEVPRLMGSGHMGTVPSRVYRTLDGYVAVEAGFNEHFRELCRAMGKVELSVDPRFVDRQARHLHRNVLNAILEEEFAHKPTREWVRILDEHNVACGPVNSVAEALVSPQSAAYSMVREVHFGTDSLGTLRMPLWFDRAEAHSLKSPPRLGEHTVEVLQEKVNYDIARIKMLFESGALAGDWPPPAQSGGMRSSDVSRTS